LALIWNCTARCKSRQSFPDRILQADGNRVDAR
jgi:hypothetical protein